MTFQINCTRDKDVTAPSLVGRQFAFWMSSVPAEFVGTVEENSKTLKLRILVKIERGSMAFWSINEEVLPRLLFYYATKHLHYLLESGAKLAPDSDHRKTVSIDFTPEARDLIATRLPDPNGYSEMINVQRKLGF